MNKIKCTATTALLGLSLAVFSLGTVGLRTAAGQAESTFRPPSVPLVACDPYFSVWSPGNHLTDVDTTHWTGKPQRLTSLVRIDGHAFRLLGKAPATVPALPQTGVDVQPTRTICTFEGSGVKLIVTFMTPALPDDIAILSRPVTYVTYECRATDGATHQVETYFDVGSEIAVNTPSQEVTWMAEAMGSVAALKVGSKSQDVLGKKGDDIRIDWGYFYLAAVKSPQSAIAFINPESGRMFFAGQGKLPVSEAGSDVGVPANEAPVAALTLDLGKVAASPVSRWLMLAYDDLYSIQYMGHNLRPYWRRNGWEATDLLQAAAKDYENLQARCVAFDAELTSDLFAGGGENYARLGSLAYRQCFAAGKFVADDYGQPLQFCKENHSNGCISTSDVFYPMSPQFLLFGPSVAKSFVVPFMNYAASDRWKFPFAPHDLGTYPDADGQVYGGGEHTEENQMPVEESGNLLILMGAIAQMEGTPEFANLYWPQLEKWAAYLKAKGFDPENQLCTDDFAGHLAHNVNLSAKAICALGSFGKLCAMRGDQAQADEYTSLARELATRWVKEAADGDHYRLAFDKPGTWSQKYNLIWDRILGLNLFPASVARTEMDYYLKIQNQYGLPLDNRKTYTKLDWITWTATLTQDRGDFEALLAPIIKFLNETPDRSPMTDWYETKTAHKVGFTARPVVGGVFAQMLYNQPVWQKYASRDHTKAGNWAPMPKPPQIIPVIPAADTTPAEWQYTTDKPAEGWAQADFDASGWKTGKSGFGVSETPSAVVGTVWNTPDIWLRREVTLSADDLSNLQLWFHHDDDAQVYVNGTRVLRADGWTTAYEAFELRPRSRAAFKPGKNVIAIHCHQTGGGQYVDLGLVKVKAY
ncbi:MAG TPA: DUF4965 domain-containing protein [Dongiaceae bacterium]|nr:DUF4965 domain-containing protein [Dongiaceae bacterium]